jgi:hypothetical protein
MRLLRPRLRSIVRSSPSTTYEGLQQQVEALYRQVFSQPAMQQQQQQTPARDTQGRFTAEQGRADEDTFAKADLELKFKRGDISTDEYLAQSGAIERHLAAQGISVDALRETTNKAYEGEWVNATNEFIRSPQGADWPGGEENKNTLGQIIQRMGLIDSPSAQTLAVAYEYAKKEGLLVENPESKALEDISTATSHEAILEAAHRASGIFGGR